jgi:hypothetical protein
MYRCWLPLCHCHRLVHTHRAIGVVDAVGRARRWKILSEVFGTTRTHQILGSRRHLPKFANRLGRYSDIAIHLDPHHPERS